MAKGPLPAKKHRDLQVVNQGLVCTNIIPSCNIEWILWHSPFRLIIYTAVVNKISVINTKIKLALSIDKGRSLIRILVEERDFRRT